MTLSKLGGLANGGDAGESVRLAIVDAASRTGASFAYLLAQAKSESGLRPDARARTSSAGGLYQFIDQTWLGMMKLHGAEHGYAWAADAIQARPGGGWRVSDPATKQAILALKTDPTAASLMAGEFANDTSAALTRSLGRTVGATDLYFGAFLGPKGAAKFLKAKDASPDAPAASLFPREAAVNRGIFYTRAGSARSLAQVYALMGRKIDGAGAPGGEVRMASTDPAPARDATATQLAARTADVLRPTPAQARLAYLMVLTPFSG